MSRELELIRTFRAEDEALDARSQEKARASLLEHIDGKPAGSGGLAGGGVGIESS
jgi:hypothetical protein